MGRTRRDHAREQSKHGDKNSGEAKTRRALKALFICTIAIAVFALALTISSGSWASAGTHAGYVGRVWNSLEEGNELDKALEKVGAMRLSKGSIPEWMLDEVLDETWLDRAIANGDQKVVWITRKGQAADICNEMTSAFESKGWQMASNNSSENMIATYVKMEGECRWLLAEYVQSGEETVAVLRTERN